MTPTGRLFPDTNTPAPQVTVTVTVPAPAPAPSATHPLCPSGITLPAGVSTMVCGGAPAGASHAPGDATYQGIYSFATPSRNIACDWLSGFGSVDGIECAIIQATFKQPPKPKDCNLSWEGHQVSVGSKATKGACRGDLMEALYLVQSGGKIPTLAYGKALAYRSWACSSAEAGLTFWNTTNHHGFLLSRTVLATW